MSLHDDEITVTADDVARMVAEQMPAWAGLPVTPVAESGTDHLLFRLGDDLVARMPKIGWAGEQALADARWLPILAPALPLAVPAPLAVGAPDGRYPFHWSVVPWLAGRAVADPLDPTASPNLDPGTGAAQLGDFLAALRAVDPDGGPVKDGTSRGVPLSRLDEPVRKAIAESGGRIDGPAVTRVWERALGVGDFSGPGTWIHGDLLTGNLLADGRRLTAVIDWGAVGVGDPAADLVPAWVLFHGRSREVFRESAGLDEAAWYRGQGWMVVQAAIALPYYWELWPQFARASQRRIAAVVADG